MNDNIVGHPRLEKLLATVLHYGTWSASGVIILGLALALVGQTDGDNVAATLSSTQIVSGGIALLILLPVIRVTLMMFVFMRERDYRFGAIAALVLTIICAGFAIGMLLAKSPA